MLGGARNDGSVGYIQRAFQLQSEHKWAAKTSSLSGRQDKLSRLRSEIIARANDIQAALSADLAKPGQSPYAPEVESMLTAIDDAVDHLEEWARPLTVQPSPNLVHTPRPLSTRRAGA